MEPLRWVLLLLGVAVLGLVFAYTRGWFPNAASLKGSLARWQKKPPPVERSEPALDAEPEPAPQSAPAIADDSRVVTIRIMPGPDGPFPAEALILSLRAQGLRHGRYKIFHRLSDDEAARIRFSVASLVEPGSFDLSNLSASEYAGISMFMVLPAPEDGVVLFDDLMQAARNIAKAVDGRLVDEQGSALSVQRERYMREEVIEYLRVHARNAAHDTHLR